MTVHEHSIEKCLISPGADVRPKYTEVIIIGNGPSALNLSFILSGYRPFYEGGVLEGTNEMLHYKLLQNPHLHILEQDLTFLSEGLEGQVTNKMALLFDKLTNPGADVGLFSQSSLSWRRNGEVPVEHVVLGKGKVGGTWQTMDRSMKSLTQAFLLQMPDMPIQNWLKKYRNKNAKKTDKPNEQTNTSNEKENKYSQNATKSSQKNRNINSDNQKNGISRGVDREEGIGGKEGRDEEGKEMQGRVTVEEMCAYFEEFVETKGLSRYFMNEHLVVGVRKIPCSRRSSSGLGDCSGGGSSDEVGGRGDEDGGSGSDQGVSGGACRGEENGLSGGYEGRCGLRDSGCEERMDNNEDNAKPLDKSLFNSLKHLIDNTQATHNTTLTNDITGEQTTTTSIPHGAGNNDNEADHSASSSFGSYDNSCSSSNLGDVQGRGEKEEGEGTMWEVYGTNSSGEEFCYRAPRLVLATGGSDRPNRLGVRGEGLPGIVHSQAEFDQHVKQVTRKDCWGCRLGRRLFRLVDRSPVSAIFEHPVVIVGSGLSAADAVLYALERGIPVVHVFEKSVEEVSRAYRFLSAILYPEYRRVFDLMTQKLLMPGFYQSFPGVRILAFLDDKQVLVQECDRTTSTTIRASLVAILIGSSPNLSFLPDSILTTLLTAPSADSHKQLVSVDSASYQNHQHPGLYAMGPLVGENYVRFLGGGAFAISSHIIRRFKT